LPFGAILHEFCDHAVFETTRTAMNISDKAKRRALITKHLKRFAYNTAMIISAALAGNSAHAGRDIPPGFVYLRDVDPGIVQDMRYAGPTISSVAPSPATSLPIAS
jgi:hypothetical protein